MTPPGTDPTAGDARALPVVKAFIGALTAKRRSAAADVLAPDAVFVNGTTGTAHGRAAIMEALEPVIGGMDELDWPILREAEADGVAFVERVDRFRLGERWAEIAVVGIFELDDEGRIASWTDTFDAASGAAALAALRPEGREAEDDAHR